MSTIRSIRLKVPYGPYGEPYGQALIFAIVSIRLEAGLSGPAAAVAGPSDVFNIEMQILHYAADFRETFDCCSYCLDQIWLLPREVVSNCSS